MNPLEFGLAFMEGLMLIASPCILPVLPLVLSGSVDGGRARPYGVITGFILSFALFALFARQLVDWLGIDLELVKDASLVLLGLFALVLILPGLSRLFSRWTQGAADIGAKAGGGRGGFFGGIGIGALIGLVWTPCAGPILAAALVQIIRQDSNLGGALTMLAFGLGAGLPMLAIALVGRKALSRAGFLIRHAEGIRRGFGVLMLVAVVFLASGYAETLLASSAAPVRQAAVASSGPLQNGLGKPYPAPEFATSNEWVNVPPQTMAGLKGKVVLVDFWTYSCINCLRTLPYLTGWDRKYRADGLVIVGVHAPEFAFEKNIANVRAAMAKYGIDYPVTLDNRLDTWTNFKNEYWPAHYLIDRQGQVVYTHFGEGAYDVTENNIRQLLGLDGKIAPVTAAAPYTRGQTPETYLGYARADRFANDGLKRDSIADYKLPDIVAPNHWALDGRWQSDGEKIVAAASNARLQLNFSAKKVFLVMGTANGQPVSATVRLNASEPADKAGADAPAGKITVDQHRLYEIVNQGAMANGVVEIIADQPGLEAYAFTFGN